MMNCIEFGDVRDVLLTMIAAGVKVNTIVTSPPYWGLRSYLPAEHPDKAREIGNEPTLAEFLETMVGVFDLCREVLADDGTMWVNMGDSYATSAGATADRRGRSGNLTNGGINGVAVPTQRARPQGSIKAKDLIGQPWRLAFALQDAGWYLRQDIIWHKPNPMPESIKDRCTKAHEYIFLLSKSERYYWDQTAMQEPVTSGPSDLRKMREQLPRIGGRTKDRSDPLLAASGATNVGQKRAVGNGETRNRRSVWDVAPSRYPGAHFATFPPALIEPCILAGAPVGGVVLDPFMGSGTTAEVAIKNGRRYLGCELNADYKPLQDARILKAILA